MKDNIFAIGLSHQEIHTLEILLPTYPSIIRCDPKKDFDDEYALENLLCKAKGIVVNPKKFALGQLQAFVYAVAHKRAAT